MNTTMGSKPLRNFTRTEATERAAEEYRRFEASIRSLATSDWDLPTPDCPAWTVRKMVAHIVGGCAACASMREMMRQGIGAKRLMTDPAWKDPGAVSKMTAMNNAMNEFQIRDRSTLTPNELMEAFASLHPKATRARARKARVFKGVRMKDSNGTSMSLTHLYRVIFTRDTWMHRADISRATGRAMELTETHDGAIVADAVTDWAASHQQPFKLVLTGPAGGTFEQGADGPVIELDAVEFCRITSGRGSGEGLLRHTIPW